MDTATGPESSLALRVARIAAIVACSALMYSPPVSNLAILVTLVATLCTPDLRSRWHASVRHPVGALTLGFVAIAALWCFVGEPRPWSHTARELWSWRKLPWLFLALMLFDDDDWKRRLSVWFVVAALPGVLVSDLAFFGVLQLPVDADKLLRNTGTQGVSFAVAAVVCFWWLLQPGLTSRQRCLWATGLALFGSNVLGVSVSRSAYLGIVVSILVVGAFRMSRRHWIMLSLALAVLVPGVFVLSDRMQERVMRGVNEWRAAETATESSSLGLRYIFYKHSAAIISKHWLVGSGTGSFNSAYIEQVRARSYPVGDWRAIATDDPHNQFVHVWIDQGLLGLVVFVAWIVAIVVQRRSAADFRALAAGLALAWSAASLFNGHFRSFAEGHLFATFAGALVSARPQRTTVPLPNERIAIA